MREILFRGKRVDNGEWIYGVPITDKATGDAYIITSTAGAYLRSEINNMCVTGFRVIPETVEPCTGLTDKNGTRIFKGDIIDVVYNPNYGGVAKKRIGTFKVGFEDGCYMYADDEGYFLFTESDEIIVIGNIHDNPELLKGEQKNETTT